jgi:S-DNA-T family DNA segregation ATPase FtsK/SpoIIIE
MMSVQAVMRFPRSNLSSSINDRVEEDTNAEFNNAGAAANNGNGVNALTTGQRAAMGQNADEIAANAIEGRAEMPLWQSAFVLAPNVRFTRTPHNITSGKRPSGDVVQDAPEQAVVASVPEEPPVAAQPVPVQAPVTVTVPVAVVSQPAPVERRIARPAVLPQPPGATGALALSYRLRRELALKQQEPAPQPVAEEPVARPVEPVTEAQIDLACFPGDGQPTRTIDVPAFATFLSDEMFWEAMNLDVDGDVVPPSQPLRLAEMARLKALRMKAAVETPVETTQPVIQQAVTAPAPLAPVAERPAFSAPPFGSAIALYREVGVQSLRTAAGAPVEEPVAAAPAPVAAAEPVLEVSPVESRRQVRAARANQPMFMDAPVFSEGEYEFPPIELLQKPQVQQTTTMTPEALEQSAGLLESVLEDFGIKGEIIDVRPGPVVTLYEFEPAPGVKSSRVIGLSDDIARSMSALSARVAVVPGRNVIGIELPNPVRETVYFRELIESPDYAQTRMNLALCLGKTIGGEPVVAELAKMPHLLVAGTTGSGKSVAINTMILSLLYRLKPEECRLIMVDPKMLELSVYDGIPHLLTPVVTDPKKAVMALKWAVREMEDRYRKMSRLGVRNIDGYNARAASARAKGETVLCSVQTGFDRASGEAVFEQEEMDLTAMPYIVVIVDEMADLMMVAGKEIEGAIQRLAQMARAAGIHLIMATQRPSVDVITGTIKANFPTRISFQVTSKIDSRTILGEQGAEHLLGQGDMLHMVGGGRISRVHGPFVSDEEVEKVVAHLKTQGRPEYLGTVTEDADEAEEAGEEDAAVFDKSAMGEDDTADLYDKAVKVVLRDKKCSTSYIQRRLSIGYNRAASLVERMEQEGIVGAANHVGKRAIIAGDRDACEVPGAMGDL